MDELYYDFHTHNTAPNPTIIKMICVRPGEVGYAAAIHPWDTGAPDIEEQFAILEKQSTSLAAIGETGLDRLRGAPLPRQIEIFQKHLAIATAHRLPVVIHNVKCTHEILSLLKTPQLTLWHRAPVRPTNLQAIISRGAMVSFRAAELAQLDPALVPLRQLGLETDDSEDDIRQTYELAAALWKLPLPELKKHLADNFHRIFTCM